MPRMLPRSYGRAAASVPNYGETSPEPLNLKKNQYLIYVVFACMFVCTVCVAGIEEDKGVGSSGP